MNREEIVASLVEKAKACQTPAQLLRFLTLEQKIEDQIELMQFFCDAFNTNLGSVTAIGGWWYESPREMNDEDVNAYVQPILDEWASL